MGWGASVLFLVMRPDARVLKPNRSTHPEFADTFAKAIDVGVEAVAATFRLEVEGERGDVYFHQVVGLKSRSILDMVVIRSIRPHSSKSFNEVHRDIR